MKKNISPARIYAYKILYDVLSNGAFSNISVSRHLISLKDENDRRLAVQIVYGTIKKKNRLSRIISDLSDISRGNIDKKVHIILMMSLYQLLFLDKTPAYAVVNDAVNLTRTNAGERSSSFVNAVLRNASRKRDELNLQTDNFEERMFLDYGFSDFELDILRKRFSGCDEAAERYAVHAQSAPPLYLRVNTLKISADGLISEFEKISVSAEKTYVSEIIKINTTDNIFASDLYKKGYFFAQDISGALSTQVLDPQKGDLIIDLCAAPGAKSFGAAIASGNTQVLACDINAKKLEIVKRSALQLGVSVRTLRRDAFSVRSGEEGLYDRVICDVPCSGLGVIARKPEILYNLTPEHIKYLIESQQKIIRAAFSYLKVGGILVYSTCTINRDENEKTAESLLAEFSNAAPDEIKLKSVLRSSHPEMKDGMLFLTPEQDECDGFFTAKIKKVRA